MSAVNDMDVVRSVSRDYRTKISKPVFLINRRSNLFAHLTFGSDLKTEVTEEVSRQHLVQMREAINAALADWPS